MIKTKNKRIIKSINNTQFDSKGTMFMDIYNQKTIDNMCGTLKSGMDHQQGNIIYTNLRIRKLTPLEAWRLMAFSDEDFEKASKVNSDTQLFKQAGNSIVVSVMESVLKILLGGSSMKEVKIEKKEERKVLRYDTDKMIDLVKLYEKEPELFKELAEDYPVEPNTSIIYNVKAS